MFVALSRNIPKGGGGNHNDRWDYYRIGTRGKETPGRERERARGKTRVASLLVGDIEWHPRDNISIDIYVYTCNRSAARLSTGSYFPVRHHGCRLSLVIVGDSLRAPYTDNPVIARTPFAF